MRHKHFITWNVARNTENVKNEKCTLQDLVHGEETEKCEK